MKVKPIINGEQCKQMKKITIEYSDATDMPENHPLYDNVSLSKDGMFVAIVDKDTFDKLKE